jgi:hypothetical protein
MASCLPLDKTSLAAENAIEPFAGPRAYRKEGTDPLAALAL